MWDNGCPLGLGPSLSRFDSCHLDETNRSARNSWPFLFGDKMIYFIIWGVVALLLIGIIGYCTNFSTDKNLPIVPLSIFWPLILVIIIGMGLGWIGKNIIIPYLKHWFVK